MNLRILGYEVAFQTGIRRVKEQKIRGYTNRCSDGRLIVLLDYDIPYSQWVIEELRFLQSKHKVGDFWVFKTNKGYHAVCLDKLSLREYVSILDASSVDPDFVKVPLKYGGKIWTLRFSPKNGKRIMFCGKIKSPWEGYRQKSRPHAKFLNDCFKLEIDLKQPCMDKNTKLILSEYRI